MFHIDIKKEDTQALQDVRTHEANLQNEINRANENISKNQELFSKEIKTVLMKQLEKDVVELESIVMDKKFLDPKTKLDDAINELEHHKDLLMKYESDFKRYNSYEDILGLAISKLDPLSNLKDDLVIRHL